VELFDDTGRAYLDFTSGIAVNALGYADAGVERVMREAMERGMLHVSNLYRTEPGESLARALVERSFASSVFFCNSGAEANEALDDLRAETELVRILGSYPRAADD
jgi:acetylornithine/succinyldiaminopimelate/putrescine aminotransferase